MSPSLPVLGQSPGFQKVGGVGQGGASSPGRQGWALHATHTPPTSRHLEQSLASGPIASQPLPLPPLSHRRRPEAAPPPRRCSVFTHPSHQPA